MMKSASQEPSLPPPLPPKFGISYVAKRAGLDIKGYPTVLRVISIIVLLPILAWPFVLYVSIFLFDNPSTEDQVWPIFFLMNSYPLVLVGICALSVWLWTKYRRTVLASTPFLMLVGIFCGVYWYSVHGPIDKRYMDYDDYRLYRDTPCEELAEAVYRQDTMTITRIVRLSPGLLSYEEPKYKQSIVFYAVKADKYDALKTLLNLGANPNQVQVYFDKDSRYTITLILLSMACTKRWDEEKKLQYVKLLVEHGADVNALFVKKLLPAKFWGSVLRPIEALVYEWDDNWRLAKYLLEHGADPNLRFDETDYPVLATAVIHDQMRTAEELIRHGADPDQQYVYLSGQESSTPRKDLIQKINNPSERDDDEMRRARRRLLSLMPPPK